ncbi:MAG: prolyl oligopeptidase family serine peptidase [Rhodospirillales bacterium]|nr:prolyl oligopeptidase family serine peptidase [Rhodospirillales bacterium]
MVRAKRMAEQEWMFDKIIQATGPDFYWPMTEETLRTVGMDGSGDIRSVRGAIRKLTDITDEMSRIAGKREAMAQQAERDGHPVTAGQNYFTAAAYYTMAQGPIHEDGNPRNLALSARKNACYDNFIAHAPHPIERIDIPFENSALPGFLHLPPNATGKTPCVVFLGGMDNFKEMLVTQPGDKFLERGMAVLALDGPGQNEALISRGIHCTEDNFVTAGKAVMDYLLTRDDIDGDRIGITGISMGSFWLTQIVAHDPRYKAAAGFYICHENGMNTIFNKANPMFKDRYMWMSGFHDEAAFDAFAARLTLEGLGAKIKCPYMMVAGEDDDLSPIEHSFKLFDEIAGPKTMLLFKDEVHGVSDNLTVRAMIADWMKDRFDGKDLQSRCIYMECRTGQEVPGGLVHNGEKRE